MKLPVIGTSFAHGRSAVTARQATNVWFEQRGEGEKAPVIASHIPGTGSSISLPGILGAATNAEIGQHYVHDEDTIYYGSPGVSFGSPMALGFTTALPI